MENNNIEKFELINGQAVINLNYNVITANEEMYRFIGTSTAAGISFLEIIHQVDLDDFIDVCHHLREGQESDMVVRMRRADNSYRWILVHIARFRLKTMDSSVDYFELYASDILALRKHCSVLSQKLFEIEHAGKISNVNNQIYTEDEAKEYCYNLIKNEPSAEFTMILGEIDDLDSYRKLKGNDFAESVINTALETSRHIMGDRGIIYMKDDEHFILIVNGINQEVNLRPFLESLRYRISWDEMIANSVDNLTLSLGVVRYPQNGDNLRLCATKLAKAIEICHLRGKSKYIIYREHLHGNITL